MENEALLAEELLVCLALPKFEDAAGCSLLQFCTALDGRGQGAAICANSDWKNDEVLGNPQDCKVEGTICVPRHVQPTIPNGHTGPDFSKN